VDQVPEYAKVMKGYEKASNVIDELQRTLSLGNKASTDTALRKLQSVTRNNVNTNYGKRADLAQMLAANGAPNLMEKITGQAMNSWAPRGLQGLLPGGMTLAALALNPKALALAPLMSPRAVGEGAYCAGKAASHAPSGIPQALRAAMLNRLFGGQ
jgi:hypothetical protein